MRQTRVAIGRKRLFAKSKWQSRDQHLAPGEGNVDFAALRTFAEGVRHVVFEPNAAVSSARLRKGLAHIRAAFARTDARTDA